MKKSTIKTTNEMKVFVEVEIEEAWAEDYVNNDKLLERHLTGRLQGIEAKVIKDSCVMPKKLTAENGAKALLMGEFYETIVFHYEEGEPYEVKMPVEWSTIKAIYKKITDHYLTGAK